MGAMKYSSCLLILCTVLLKLSLGTLALVIECKNATRLETSILSGEFVSPGYAKGLKYPSDLYCGILLQAGKDEKIRLSVLDLDMEQTLLCSSDSLALRGLDVAFVAVICGRTKPADFLYQGNKLQVLFASDQIRSGRGFKIRWTFTNSTTLCKNNEFQCEDRTCVLATVRCNGVFDCSDASDESNCEKTPDIIPVKCGRPVIQPDLSSSDRIVGGKEVVPGSWPWQVGLSLRAYEHAGDYCGGTLVNERWIVTAGHCFDIINGKEDFFVKIGSHNRVQKDSGEQWRFAEKYIVHPNYIRNSGIFFHDIALIKLSIPVNFTDTVRPACLPTTKSATVDSTCYSTGWGQTRGTGNGNILKQEAFIVKNISACESALFPIDDAFMICGLAKTRNSGVCHGDSGGPFVCLDKDTWTLQGLTSTAIDGSLIGGICGLGERTVWNRVYAQMEWIRNMMKLL